MHHTKVLKSVSRRTRSRITSRQMLIKMSTLNTAWRITRSFGCTNDIHEYYSFALPSRSWLSMRFNSSLNNMPHCTYAILLPIRLLSPLKSYAASRAPPINDMLICHSLIRLLSTFKVQERTRISPVKEPDSSRTDSNSQAPRLQDQLARAWCKWYHLQWRLTEPVSDLYSLYELLH